MNATTIRRNIVNVLAGIAVAGGALIGLDATLATAPSNADDLAGNGVCRTFTGADVVTVCAPLLSPSGATMVGPVEEDGSAAYGDGLIFDAEDAAFHAPIG